MPRVPVPYPTRPCPDSLELAEIHLFLDEFPSQQECSFDVRDYGQVVDRGGDEQSPDVVVYFIVAPRIRPIAKKAILKQCDPGIIKAVRMRYLDGMQCILQDRSDVWKVNCAMVLKYLDQKIATVKFRPNPESNHVFHRSLFWGTGVERPLVAGRGRRGQSTSCLGKQISAKLDMTRVLHKLMPTEPSARREKHRPSHVIEGTMKKIIYLVFLLLPVSSFSEACTSGENVYDDLSCTLHALEKSKKISMQFTRKYMHPHNTRMSWRNRRRPGSITEKSSAMAILQPRPRNLKAPAPA